MNDQAENGNGKSLRDHFPIVCDACKRKIVKREKYRIVGLRAGTGEKPLAENVYRHRTCTEE